MVVREIRVGETSAAFEALRELRPNLPAARTEFDSLIDTVLRPQGYRLVGAFVGGEPAASAVAGFRCMAMLAYGRLLYVDDLTTVPAARRLGLGRLLLDWVAEEARRLGCDQLHLDSGVGPTRVDAHRLYMRTGLQISAFHFSRSLDPSD